MYGEYYEDYGNEYGHEQDVVDEAQLAEEKAAELAER
jgi:hypothetical protein